MPPVRRSLTQTDVEPVEDTTLTPDIPSFIPPPLDFVSEPTQVGPGAVEPPAPFAPDASVPPPLAGLQSTLGESVLEPQGIGGGTEGADSTAQLLQGLPGGVRPPGIDDQGGDVGAFRGMPAPASNPFALRQDIQTVLANAFGDLDPTLDAYSTNGVGVRIVRAPTANEPDGQGANQAIFETVGGGDAGALIQHFQTNGFPLRLVENGMGSTPGSRRLIFEAVDASGGGGGTGGGGTPPGPPLPGPGPLPPPNQGPNVPPIDPNPDPPPPVDTTGGPGVFPGDNLQQVGQDPVSQATNNALIDMLRRGLGPRGSDTLGAAGALLADAAGPVGGAGLQTLINSILTGRNFQNDPTPSFSNAVPPDLSSTPVETLETNPLTSGSIETLEGGGAFAPPGGLTSHIVDPGPEGAGNPLVSTLDAGTGPLSASQGVSEGGPVAQGVLEGAPVATDAFASSPGPFVENPNPVGGDIGAALTQQLMQMLQSGGQGDPRIADLQFERANELVNRARESSQNQTRAGLASRGLASVSGVPQGEEAATLRRIEERIQPEFAAAVRDIAIAEAERNEGRFQNALGQAGQQAALEEGRFDQGFQGALELAGLNEDRLANSLAAAVGLSQTEAQVMLGSINSSTDRQRVMGELALQSLDQNMQWNQFLAEFGLSRDIALEQLRSGRLQDVQGILALFSQFIDSARTGQVA